MRTLTIDKTKEWTIEDYLLLGETSTPCQLINGELIMSPAPTPKHQRVARNIFKAFDRVLGSKGEIFFSPIDLYLDSKNVFQPDLIFIANQNKMVISERGIEGPVEIVVEIISPFNSYTDRNLKKDLYLKFKVGEYWIVDPGNKTIEIYTPAGGATVPVFFVSVEGEVKSIFYPELSIDLKQIF
jgi:Uma2 family endonuclease